MLTCPLFLAIKSELKRADCISWKVCIPRADSLNDPLLVRSKDWRRFVYAAQLVCVLQCHHLLLLHAYVTCTREWCMRFVFMHTVFSISKSTRALCHSKHPSPIDLTTSWESQTHKYTDTDRGTHWRRSCSLPTWQEMRTFKPKKYINLESSKVNKHLLKSRTK